MTTFINEFPSATAHEKFSIMLQERVETLEAELATASRVLAIQSHTIQVMHYQMRISIMRGIVHKYNEAYSSIVTSPIYYFKVLAESLEFWYKRNKKYYDYDTMTTAIDEVRMLLPNLCFCQPSLQNPDMMTDADAYKVKVTYLLSMMSIDELFGFDIDDTIPDLVLEIQQVI